MIRTENKVCLVAGNLGKLIKDDQFKTGLGATIAQQLANTGATVIITDLEDKVVQTCLSSLTGDVHGRTCDFLSERKSERITTETEKGPKTQVKWINNPVRDLINSISKEFGRLDVVISNFDYYKHNKIEKSSEDFFNELRTYNTVPTFRLMAGIRDVLAMQKKNLGINAQIIIITNIAGKAGISLSSVYSAMKGGDIGLTKCLAREFSRFATVNAISYGLFSHKKMQGPMDRFKKNFMATKSEAAKINLKFEHIAPVVSFLASDGARAMNGQILNVDGGLWLKLET